MCPREVQSASEEGKCDDARLRHHVVLGGRGTRPMVFAHGFGTDQRVWRFVEPQLGDGYRTVLFDHAGCGKALPCAYDAARHDDLRGYAQDLLEVCRDVASEPITFVGHSVGTMIGILASIEAPELFDRLVLVAASARYLNDPPRYHGGFDEADVVSLLEMMEQNFLGWATAFASVAAKDAATSEELFALFCSADPRTIRRFAEVTFHADVREQLRRVSVPSLLLQCAYDDIVPASVSEYMHRELKNSELQVLPVAGHCPQVSDPELIVSAVRRYLSLNSDSARH